MNKNYKLLIGIGALAALYFVFKKKGTTAKSTSTDKAESSTIKSAKVEGGTISIDEKEILDNIKSKTAPKAGDSAKVIAIKKFFAEVTTNPPKSEEEFLSRASKAGLSKADLQSPEAQKIMNPFASFDGDFNSKKRQDLRMEFGLSVEDDERLTTEKERLLSRNQIEKFDNDEKRRQRFLSRNLKRFAISNKLNYEAFKNVEAGMKSNIKPTSVSGISMVQRPRNYGTAQRPTRALTPISITSSFAGFMDFDGNDDVQGSIM